MGMEDGFLGICFNILPFKNRAQLLTKIVTYNVEKPRCKSWAF